ncbi:MAG: hypothetical protein MUD13_08135 [Candidatus Nanopelagicales bacterium]|nr:hypothetical protein [Candidatus Nanopelagicales bacterium]
MTGQARTRRGAPALLAPELLLAYGWVLSFAALQWSVVRFKVPIVLALTAAAIGLAVWQVRRIPIALTVPAVSVMLVGSALVTATVPLFSYVDAAGLAVARVILVATCLAALVALRAGRAVPALAVAVGGYLAMAVLVILRDPAPRIDVWVTLQQATQALRRGENFYALQWIDSPGVSDAFTYLPWTAVLLAPGRWLAGDVRWALVGWTLVAVAAVWALAARDPGGRWRAAAVGTLLLLAPGTLTQVDQAWTEPLLLAGLAWWAALVRRGHAGWAIVPLALACASKQHLVLLLPLLALWRPFGWRRSLATGVLAGLLVLPWFLAGPADFLDDTVLLLVSFHAILFANTWYLLALNVFGVELPFWVTGLVVLGTLGLVARTVHRRQPDLGELLRWMALLLLVANLVNKQAFYNQFWLCGALVVVSLALPAAPAVRGGDGGPADLVRGRAREAPA